MPKLTIIQIEQVFFFIDDYVVQYNIPLETLQGHFESSTDSFVDFILAVEKYFTWFDYTQIQQVLEILDIFIQKAHEDMYSAA